MATCSASLSSIGLSGLASGACAASPARAWCSVYCARTGKVLNRDWNVGTSMRVSASFRDFPNCANKPSMERTSSSSTRNPPTSPPCPGMPGTPPTVAPRSKAEAVSHFPGAAPSGPPAPPPPPPPPTPPPPTPPRYPTRPHHQCPRLHRFQPPHRLLSRPQSPRLHRRRCCPSHHPRYRRTYHQIPIGWDRRPRPNQILQLHPSRFPHRRPRHRHPCPHRRRCRSPDLRRRDRGPVHPSRRHHCRREHSPQRESSAASCSGLRRSLGICRPAPRAFLPSVARQP